MSNEPLALARGKAFHKLIQEEWEKQAEGNVKREKHIIKPNGRKGRVDIFVDDDDPKASIAVVEVKGTDWDKVKTENIKRNIMRQIKQIWSYIESQIINGRYTDYGEHKDVCPGIIFPRAPRDLGLKNRIVSEFEDYGIVVVWHDEKNN